MAKEWEGNLSMQNLKKHRNYGNLFAKIMVKGLK